MAKKTINLKGTAGTTYNIDEITAENRLNANKKLTVQVYKYKQGENPNPADLQQGQIWLSVLNKNERE